MPVMRLAAAARRRLVVAVVLGVALVSAAVAAPAATPRFQVGVTHTQHSADDWNNPLAVARARGVLKSSVHLQAQALMGWGTLNPEPSPGVFDWTTLDERLHLITASGGRPVLTLCCAPDWMKGGLPGVTDWKRLEAAPLEAHFRDYAALAVAATTRHPEVRTVVVWNELKGFYDAKTNTWNIAAYTRLYNAMYDALKRHDPTLQVGGPYVPMDLWSSARTMSHPSTLKGPWGVVDGRALAAVQYWLAHAHGYDFVAVDGGTKTRDRGLVTGDLQANGYFAAVTGWLRARTTKPVWWSEFYPARAAGSSAAHGVAVLDGALATMQRAGVRVAMAWQPEGPSTSCVTCLWTDTTSATGGVKAPYADVLRRYNSG